MDNLELSAILLNLKIVGLLRQHERLSTVDNKIVVDRPSMIQGLKRWIRGEDRKLNIEVLDQLVRRAILYMKSARSRANKLRVASELLGARQGLLNLQTTYENDSLIVASIGVLLDLIESNVLPHHETNHRAPKQRKSGEACRRMFELTDGHDEPD